MTFRDAVERGFETWTDGVVRARWLVIAAVVVATACLSLGVPRLEIETSYESYLPDANERQQQYRRFREQFGSSERVVVLLEPHEVFDPRFLAELRLLHERLETELPWVDRVTSLVNARHLTGHDDVLRADGLLDAWPEAPDALDRAHRTALANPLYRNTLLSSDGTATTIVIELDGAAGSGETSLEEILEFGDGAPGGDTTGDGTVDAAEGVRGALLTTEQADDLVSALEPIMAESSPGDTRVYVSGTPLLAQRIGAMLTRDITVFFSVSFALTGVFLLLLFRTSWGVALPLVVVGLSVVGTLGLMGLSGTPLTAVTEILPTLLVAVGVGDAVHIQAMFCKRREAGDSTRDALRWAMGHSGLAVLLTSLTTAASMAAFRSADLQPVIDLGGIAPAGVMLALVYSVSLLPALLSFVPDQVANPVQSAGRPLAPRFDLDAALVALGRTGTQHPRSVLAICAVGAALAALGASSLRFSQDDLRWLPEDDSIRIATERINSMMEGAEPFELLIEIGGDEGGAPLDIDFRDPSLLAALDAVQREAGSLEIGAVSVGQAISLVDVVKETHDVLTEGDGARRVLPESRALISQELLLFESAAPDDLAELSDPTYRTLRLAMTVPFVDALNYPRFGKAVEKIAVGRFAEAAPSVPLVITATGLMTIAGETFDLLFSSMARSYTIAIGAILALMFLLIGDLRMGLLSIVPNLLPILLVLGIMGLVGTPIDVSSMLVGGILIGVVVDDTIHFVHNFTRYRGQSGCSLAAIHETLITTGRAMLVTSVVLAIGFYSFMQAWLQNVSDFGFYCGTGVILAFLADVVVTPALVAVAFPCDPDCRCDHA